MVYTSDPQVEIRKNVVAQARTLDSRNVRNKRWAKEARRGEGREEKRREEKPTMERDARMCVSQHARSPRRRVLSPADNYQRDDEK